MVEAHDEVRPLEALHKMLGPVLAENLVAIVSRAVSHAKGHSHFVLFIPASDVIGCPLGLKVEINNIHGMLWALGLIEKSGSERAISAAVCCRADSQSDAFFRHPSCVA